MTEKPPSTEELTKLSLLDLIGRAPLFQVCTLIAAVAGTGYWFGLRNLEAKVEIEKSQVLQQRSADPSDSKRILEELAGLRAQIKSLTSNPAATPSPGQVQQGDIRAIGASSDPSLKSACAILEAGNSLYQQSKLEDALGTYLAIAAVDKNGRDQCTPSIYATIGTVYMLLANRAASANTMQVNIYLRKAAMYNRAFANAVACNKGDCSESQVFWRDNGGIWSK